jgi:hypothetical protein
MGKKYKYQIGDWVGFKTYIKVASSDGHRKAYEVGLAKEKFGQICGAIVRHLGDIKSYEDFSGRDNYLVIRKAVILYQVRDGMINIPFEIREEDIRCIEEAHYVHKKIPWKKVYISDWEREQMRESAKTQPRDSKGRFVRHHLRAVNE